MPLCPGLCPDPTGSAYSALPYAVRGPLHGERERVKKQEGRGGEGRGNRREEERDGLHPLQKFLRAPMPFHLSAKARL